MPFLAIANVFGTTPQISSGMPRNDDRFDLLIGNSSCSPSTEHRLLPDGLTKARTYRRKIDLPVKSEVHLGTCETDFYVANSSAKMAA